MTVPADASIVLPASQVAELIVSIVRAMRAFQMYLPNNPIYQRAVAQVRTAFGPVWAATDSIELRVVETDLVWEDQVVYQQLSKSESFAWALYKDGLRVLTLSRGVEDSEIARFLDVVNRARFLPAEASDDLLTLLWNEEFQWITYQFAEPYGDAPPPERAGTEGPGAGADALSPEARQARIAEDAPPRGKGIVTVE
ncbi:MAG: hypothetical protein H0U85_05645, partial [Gemmatimonadales bacterium]|nr:hypothetical protein [Gemmatimonadales bacterium]